MLFQRTICKPVSYSGIGLHTGVESELTFRPAPQNFGIHFVRKDLKNSPSVQVNPQSIVSTAFATTLGNSDFSISTVEHCLSALAVLRIDNLIIELNGPELPIGDGSAKHFWKLLKEAGFYEQDTARKYLYITEPILFEYEDKYAYVSPYNGLRLTCVIDFSHPQIGKQEIDIDVNENTFDKELSNSRTFGFLKDVELLRKNGLGLGGSLDNVLVLGEEKLLNEEGLRHPDEFVRHKAMDALGDLVTLGFPILGHIKLHKAGHDVMSQFVKKIISSKNSYQIIELGSQIDVNFDNLFYYQK